MYKHFADVLMKMKKATSIEKNPFSIETPLFTNLDE